MTQARYEAYADTPETWAVRDIRTQNRCSAGGLSPQAARDTLARVLRADRRATRAVRADRRREARLSWLRDDTDHSGF